MRAQLLDGSATDVLSTVRRLGFLQLDPISTVAPPQHLVLWSRLGPFDRGELDRLLWEERKLVEWNAFLWPAEDLPLLKARMRRRDRPLDLRLIAYLKENASFRRYVLRELERRGPLLSREIEDHRPSGREAHRWWGERKMGLMLGVLNARGEVAVVGRRGKQRLWDLAERWYPETERIPWAEAKRQSRGEAVPVARRAARARTRCSRTPTPTTGRCPGTARRSSRRSTGSIHDRDRALRAVGLLLPARDVRAEGRSASTATTSCRSSAATG